MDPRICDVWDVREQIVVVVDSESGVSYVIMWNLLLSLIVTHLHSKQYWFVQCCTAVGSKVSNPWEGIENVSHAEIHFSVYENVVRLPISTAIVVLIWSIYHVKTLISYSWAVHLSRNWHACRPGGLSFVVLFNFSSMLLFDASNCDIHVGQFILLSIQASPHNSSSGNWNTLNKRLKGSNPSFTSTN